MRTHNSQKALEPVKYGGMKSSTELNIALGSSNYVDIHRSNPQFHTVSGYPQKRNTHFQHPEASNSPISKNLQNYIEKKSPEFTPLKDKYAPGNENIDTENVPELTLYMEDIL
jgi:hypothetical protein